MPPETSHAGSSPAHIGHVMERVRRQAELSPEALARKTRTGLDHLTGVLAGHRFPTRRFTVTYARACGADPQVLLLVWENENDRRSAPAHAMASGPPASVATPSARTSNAAPPRSR
ncbi:helix-turn-helix transcriptional regulator [Streptomyces sp. NPDC005435]|uniref:helix-turn-helix domain-containing protein n=1 Tax=Streptomyces sp. NPDC005435 TaxID=3154464 RepID=UPI00345460F3